LPREHNLRGPIISRRHVAGHLRILYSGKTKVAYLGCCAVSQRKAAREGSDLEITILVHKDVAWFLWYGHKTCVRVETEPIQVLRAYKIAVDDAGRMHILKPTLNGKDINIRIQWEKVGLTRIWYKKY